jgi:HK97 family phage major capsid protein
MSQKLRELREQRGQLVKTARDILDKADAEKRSLTAEEEANYDQAIKDQEELRAKIEREERQIELDRELAGKEYQKEERNKPNKDERKSPRATDEYRAAYAKFMAHGLGALSGDEARALQADSDTAGGFLVMPEQMVADLIKSVDDMVFIRQRATKYQVPGAASLGVPTLDADPADADWTAELLSGNEDSTMAFGKRSLTPSPVAKRIKISAKLLRQVPSVEALVRARLAYKFGITQEKALLTGSGVNQPLGVFTASANGIPTSRDVSTGNTATSVTFDGLIEAKYSLKGQYWSRADWLFHRDALKQISKIKNGDGEYQWRQSVREGEPDMLLGRPFMMSEYAPNTFTTGLYVGLLGDFSNYWIADALDMQVQRLVELYAETNQIGFIGRMESDGMPVLAEAFARVKLG